MPDEWRRGKYKKNLVKKWTQSALDTATTEGGGETPWEEVEVLGLDIRVVRFWLFR